MPRKGFIAVILLLALVGWGSFVSIITYTGPGEGIDVLFLFYLSLSVAIFGSLTLVNFYLRKKFLNIYQDRQKIILYSLRQGFILTAFFMALLMLQSLEILSVLVVVLMFSLITALELYISL